MLAFVLMLGSVCADAAGCRKVGGCGLGERSTGQGLTPRILIILIQSMRSFHHDSEGGSVDSRAYVVRCT